MPVFMLNKNISFPLPELAEPNGLLAVGGDLSTERLRLAYSNGIFPWYNEGDEIMWWCPRDRYIIRPTEVHVSHSMKKFLRKHRCEIIMNRDFRDTVRKCREKREFTVGTWISDEIEEAYYRLYSEGFAMSVESYFDGELAGGLYGVTLGFGFMGESMFTELENGSKAALIGLARVLAANGYSMIDCQFRTDHLESMGAVKISYKEYMRLLRTKQEPRQDNE